jgi:hypothetical protein
VLDDEFPLSMFYSSLRDKIDLTRPQGTADRTSVV